MAVELGLFRQARDMTQRLGAAEQAASSPAGASQRSEPPMAAKGQGNAQGTAKLTATGRTKAAASALQKRLEERENYIKASITHISYEKYEKQNKYEALAPEAQEMNDKIHQEQLMQEFKIDLAKFSARRRRRINRARNRMSRSVLESGRAS